MARRRWKMDEIKTVVAGENPFKQFGYAPPEPQRKIGDRWTDARGKTWEQKDGYKVVVNEKADQIRDLTRQNCERCNMDMRWGNRLDKQFFRKSGMCYNCTIIHDTELMLNGNWDKYEKKKTLKYQLSWLKDVRAYVKESIDYLSTTDGKMHFVDEMGGVETWTNTQIDELLVGAKSDYEKLTKDIDEIEKMISDLEDVKELNAK